MNYIHQDSIHQYKISFSYTYMGSVLIKVFNRDLNFKFNEKKKKIKNSTNKNKNVF